MRRLAQILTARAEAVVRAHRHIRRLFVIAVEVSEPEAVGTVGVFHPAFECGLDALALVEFDLAHRDFLAAEQAAQPYEHRERQDGQHFFRHRILQTSRRYFFAGVIFNASNT